MAESDNDRNQAILAALREEFEPLLERLSSEIEPATVYTPVIEASSAQE